MSASNNPTNPPSNENLESNDNSTNEHNRNREFLARYWNLPEDRPPTWLEMFLHSTPGFLRARFGRRFLDESDDEPEEPEGAEEPDEAEEPEGAEEHEDFEDLEDLDGPEQPVGQAGPSRSTAPSGQQHNTHIQAWGHGGGPSFVAVSDLPSDDRRCCICQEEFYDFGPVTPNFPSESYADAKNRKQCRPAKLRCGHIVGDKCLRLWMNNSLRRGLNARCPICRTTHRRAAPTVNESWFLAGLEH